jgi:transposase
MSIANWQHLNLLSALCVSPAGRTLKLHRRSYWRTVRGDEVVAFLKLLLRVLRGPIVLVWDRHPIHRRRSVQAFLARHARIQLYWFPTRATELNPAQYISARSAAHATTSH